MIVYSTKFQNSEQQVKDKSNISIELFELHQKCEIPGYVPESCYAPQGEDFRWPGGPVPRPFSQRVFFVWVSVMVLFLSDRTLTLCGFMLRPPLLGSVQKQQRFHGIGVL